MFMNMPEYIRQAEAIAEETVYKRSRHLQALKEANHRKVLQAFQSEHVTAYHLHGTTGYGLGDSGRDVLDRVFARVLGTEAALVRGQFVSGTHAIAAALFGVLRPGDHVLSVTGNPYDTLEEVVGLRGKGHGSLRDFGVEYSAVPLDAEGDIQYSLVKNAIRPNTKLIIVQRSRGYAWRKSITIEKLSKLVQFVRQLRSNIYVFVDNCYGELVETLEPGDVGVDLMAGSLIKNLGGSLAPTGGYVAGKRELVELTAQRLTAPGIGAEIGATLEWQRLFFQGLYFSPLTVAEALKGAIFAAAFWQALGFEVNPLPEDERTDLIQAVRLGSRERMVAFCQGIQHGSPIDSHVYPEPAEMPGYEDEVIMAGGTFIQGATSEFSADGPLRQPFIVYQQGGIAYHYIKFGNLLAAKSLWEQGLLNAF